MAAGKPPIDLSERLLTATEAGELLGYQSRQIRRLCEAGLLPGVKLPTVAAGGYEWRIRASDVRNAEAFFVHRKSLWRKKLKAKTKRRKR